MLVHVIANDIASLPALLSLRTRRLTPDAMARYGCSRHTAMDAIRMARRWVSRGAAA